MGSKTALDVENVEKSTDCLFGDAVDPGVKGLVTEFLDKVKEESSAADTVPHIATPGENGWDTYEIASNMFPGGAVCDSSIKEKDAQHVECKRTFNDSWASTLTGGLVSGFGSHFAGYDIKSADGGLSKREVDLSYFQNGANVGKDIDVAGPDSKPLKGVVHYELKYNSKSHTYDVEFGLSDGRTITGQSTNWAELKNIKWDNEANLGRKNQEQNLATPPRVATPGTPEWHNDAGEGLRHFPGGSPDQTKLQSDPRDVEHIGFKGSFNDGIAWFDTHFQGYDVKDKAGNLLKRDVNFSYVSGGKNIG